MPTTRAARRAAAAASSTPTTGPRALPAAARPRHRAVAPTPRALRLRSSRQGAAVLSNVITMDRNLLDDRNVCGRRWLPTAALSPARRTTVKVWPMRAHHPSHRHVMSLAMLPGGARVVSVGDETAKLCTLDGARAHLRSALRAWSRRCPTACTLWSALPTGSGCTTSTGRLSTLQGLPDSPFAITVTIDGQHIISGAETGSSRCGACRAS